MTSEALRDSIKVVVRIRPLNEKEINEGSQICVRVDDTHRNQVLIDSGPRKKMFRFDWVADRSSKQKEVYNVVGNKMLDAYLEGKLNFSQKYNSRALFLERSERRKIFLYFPYLYLLKTF